MGPAQLQLCHGGDLETIEIMGLISCNRSMSTAVDDALLMHDPASPAAAAAGGEGHRSLLSSEVAARERCDLLLKTAEHLERRGSGAGGCTRHSGRRRR